MQWTRFFRRKPRDSEIDEEVRAHLRMAIQDRIDQGASPEEARRAARLELGNVTLANEDTRAVWVWVALERLGQDLRYALRQMRHSPGFTAIAVLTLSLGIGANTAMFSVVKHALFQAINVESPGDLVWISHIYPDEQRQSRTHSYHLYTLLRDMEGPFRGFAAVAGRPTSLLAGDKTSRVQVELVTGEYFSLLRTQAQTGRLLDAADADTQGANPVVVLSHPFWTARFGSDPDVIGSTVHLTGNPYTVVGVTRKGFTGLNKHSSPHLWAPMSMTSQIQPGWKPKDWQSPGMIWLNIVGRLDRDVSPTDALAAARVAWERHIEERITRWTTANPEEIRSLREDRLTLQSAAYGDPEQRAKYQEMLMILGIVAGLLLLITCANVANLLLERGFARRQELSIRLAIGAARGRVARQLLTESILLATIGGAVGLLLAWNAVMAASALLGFKEGVPLDSGLLAFTIGLSVLTGILFGLVPAFWGSHLPLSAGTKGTTTLGEQNRYRSLRGVFVTAQVALCLPALVAAGLLLRSLQNLYAVDTGLDTTQVIQGKIATQANGYDMARSRSVLSDLLTRVEATPGIRSVAVGEASAFSNWTSGRSLFREGGDGVKLSVNYAAVSPSYFETLGIPLLAGRSLSSRDTLASSKVAVVSQTLARKLFRGESPLGRRISFRSDGPFETTIVGIVADSKKDSLREETRNMLYFPINQRDFAEVTVYLRADATGSDAGELLRKQLKAIDPHLPVFGIEALQAKIDDTLSSERMLARLLTGFGFLGLFLAAIGLYGVLAYGVSRRVREFGLRKALGARRGDLVGLVLRGGLGWIAVGVVFGLAGAIAVAQLIEGLLFGIKPLDPLTYAASGGFLVLAALCAAVQPALRATRIEPMEALRYE